MKRFCILMICLLLFRPALSLHAQMLQLSSAGVSTPLTATVSDGDRTSEYSVITGFENMEYLTHLPEFRMVQRTSPHDINDLVNHVYPLYRINAYVQHPDGSAETIALTVLWDCFGNDVFRVDTTTPGSYTEIGRIQLPNAQTVFGDGVPSTLTLPVTVYVPDTPVEITSIRELDEDFLFYSSYALEQYHDISEVTDRLRTTWVCEDANGHEYECPLSLDTSLVDADTPGLYEITGTFLPPLHCTFPEALTVPTFTLRISVQASGEPRLDCMQPSVWFLYFPWIAKDMDLDSMIVRLSENDGEWRELCLYDEVYLTDSDLSLDTYFLTEGNSYRLQVDYEGGQTGIASFDYDEGVFQFKDYVDGDRDGGDTDGQPPIVAPTPSPAPTAEPTAAPTVEPTAAPTVVPSPEPTVAPTVAPSPTPTAAPMPTPTMVPTASPSAKPTTEPTAEPTVTPTPPSLRPEPYLLGSEVLQMVKNTGYARFSNQEIMLSLSADTVKELELKEEEQLLVTLKPAGSNGFSLDIRRNGVSVTDLAPMQVTLPYIPRDTSAHLILVDSKGDEVAQGTLSKTQGLVTFTLHQTGTFSIQEHSDTKLLPDTDSTITVDTTTDNTTTGDNESDETHFPWPAIVVVFVTLTLTVVLFTLYRKKGR